MTGDVHGSRRRRSHSGSLGLMRLLASLQTIKPSQRRRVGRFMPARASVEISGERKISATILHGSSRSPPGALFSSTPWASGDLCKRFGVSNRTSTTHCLHTLPPALTQSAI